MKFLQGQLSNDVSKLSAEKPLLAGFHNPQGRVIALLRLVWLGGEDILAILPRELAAPVAARLSKFVLRAKVKIGDDSASWRVIGIDGVPPQAPGVTVVALDASSTRAWLVAPADKAVALENYAVLDREGWRALDIAAGLPQVHAATSEAFVAQMLNLDVLDGIAFDKGCYTGQEVIARAHYRGRIKRRMQRFRTHDGRDFARGDMGQFTDGRSFKIVEAARLGDNHWEFLAVAPITAHGDDSTIETDTSLSLDAETLTLPYALPA